MNDDGASDNLGTSVVMARHKIVFVGDVSVGKTSIMCRFTENVFKEHYDVYINYTSQQ
jgi:GTPase SAR1 family protein